MTWTKRFQAWFRTSKEANLSPLLNPTHCRTSFKWQLIPQLVPQLPLQIRLYKAYLRLIRHLQHQSIPPLYSISQPHKTHLLSHNNRLSNSPTRLASSHKLLKVHFPQDQRELLQPSACQRHHLPNYKAAEALVETLLKRSLKWQSTLRTCLSSFKSKSQLDRLRAEHHLVHLYRRKPALHRKI